MLRGMGSTVASTARVENAFDKQYRGRLQLQDGRPRPSSSALRLNAVRPSSAVKTTQLETRGGRTGGRCPASRRHFPVRRVDCGMLVAIRALVLHAFDYLETSRVLRLPPARRGHAIARQRVRRTRAANSAPASTSSPRAPTGYIRPTRDSSTPSPPSTSPAHGLTLALDFDRFMAASAMAEIILRIAGGDANPTLLRYGWARPSKC